ncbi:MAG: dihydropteroate synthase [Verrucomicrobiota bacterium]|jgi:dihydropteroate synthase
MQLRFQNRAIEFPRRPLVMGIVNVNDDSFCADGSLEKAELFAMIRRQLAQGADVIDIGAESARTNRAAVSVDEEIRRFRLVLECWEEIWCESAPVDATQVWPPVLSANTWRTAVIDAVLRMGAEWINDMSGLPDAANARLCADAGAALLIMHSVGEPKVPHFHQQWDDVMASIMRFFEEKIALAEAAGLSRECIMLDPGIDFAKQKDDNLAIYRNLDRLTAFGRPLLVPVSRKTVIADVLGIADPRERDAATIACLTWCARRGGNIFRVHHVEAASQVVRCLDIGS